MRRTLQEINGKWEWIENPQLDEDMKHPVILEEGHQIPLSQFDINELIAKGAVPVNKQIEEFCKKNGLQFNTQPDT